ncbi:MAG: hypothetical protein QGH63_03110, partial [Rhodospirillales bacterium]|nr:hypothetical protein [Rhodospirillales bacterium]
MSITAPKISDLQNGEGVGAKITNLLSDFSVHYMWEKKWFFIALIVGAAMLSLPTPGGLSPEAWI